ncbi:MAG TPA: hypothetical protein VFV72_15750 [Candidatus Limnocylindrales bacterium]|nr:hypothetical protein [Candidatus Limnocylindrales bacterium]
MKTGLMARGSEPREAATNPTLTTPRLTRAVAWLGRVPIHPLLFAAYGVLFLYSVNLDEVLPVDAGAPLGRFVLAAAGLTAVFGLLFRSVRRGAVVATAIVVAFVAFGHVASSIADFGVDERAQLVVWASVVVAAVVYATRARGSLPRVTAGLNVVAAVLIVAVLATIVPYEAGRFGRGSTGPVGEVSAAAHVQRRPDIYFLVFDRYGSAEAIQRRFGLENDLYAWLEAQGFEVPDHSHANYRATDFSLAATLNMRFLDGLTEEIGTTSGDRTPARAMLQDHEVGQFLKAQGYRYYQLGSWYGPTRTIGIADENVVRGETSEFESVLRDTTIEPTLERVLGTAAEETAWEDRPFRDRAREGTLFQLRQLRRVMTAPGPKFVFAHVLLPHDPYVFRADGSALPEKESKEADEADLYAGQLAYANAQIRDIVGRLLSGPESERPIVIIEGDEGPLACRNVDCVSTSPDYLRIRLGNLIAMYLPGVDPDVPDTFTSVNTFRLVFREYFGADLPPLPDRSFTWPDNDHIYDFRDVTAQIGGPTD